MTMVQEQKWPWEIETDRAAWVAYVKHELKAASDASDEFAAMTFETFEEKLKKMFEFPPSWSSIRSMYLIFKAGFDAKEQSPKPIVYLIEADEGIEMSNVDPFGDHDHYDGNMICLTDARYKKTSKEAITNIIRNILSNAGVDVRL